MKCNKLTLKISSRTLEQLQKHPSIRYNCMGFIGSTQNNKITPIIYKCQKVHSHLNYTSMPIVNRVILHNSITDYMFLNPQDV